MGLFHTKKAEPADKLQWNPKPDITTYELAQCLNVFLAKEFGKTAMFAAYRKLRRNAARHFKVWKEKKL